ncbi:MAG: hypothetical protein V3R96_06570 [Dehalococcoidales bacterium]
MSSYRWWGGRFSEPAESLSMLELVNFGSLNLRLAGILWLIMEHRASALVAAGPSNAGKSTLLNALMDFLPPEVKQIQLEGQAEDFKFTEHSVPAVTYMVAAELSNFGFYLWGDEARMAFDLLSRGYGLGSTIHARTLKETIGILYNGLELSLSLIANLDVIITISVTGDWRDATEPIRRVETAGLLIGAEKDGLSLAIIASRNQESGELVFGNDAEVYGAISGRFGIKEDQIEAEIQLREQFLGNLLAEGKHSRNEVRDAVVEFYKDRL